MKRNFTYSILLVASALLVPGLAYGQDYQIKWYSVNSGGGKVSSATYSLTGSVGQAVAGRTGDGVNLIHHIGFWSVGPGYTITGSLVLEDYSGVITSIPVTVVLHRQGGATTTRTVFLDTNGGFTISDVEPGTYDITIKASHWLQRVVNDVQVTTTPPAGPSGSPIAPQ